MNYFLKKRHSRALTILLVVCLVASMFAGCRKKAPEETTPTTEENSLPAGLVEVKPTEATTAPTEAALPEKDNIAIVKDQLNVRSSPSTGAKIIGYLDPGTEVEIIKTEPYMGVNWALIREGWIMLDYVEMKSGSSLAVTEPTQATEPTETKPAETTSTKGTVTANPLNIRKEADKTSTVVGTYTKGTVITILETKNGWGRTDKGWVSMTYVSTNGATQNTTTTTTTTTTTNGTTYFVTAGELNIRDEASTNGKQVGMYHRGDKVVISQTSNGWGKTDKGWISMQYVYKTGDNGKNPAKGIVTGNGLNVRSGPGTGYGAVGTMNYGDRANILERITIGNTTWGCTSKGWISLGYVYLDGTKGENNGTGYVTGDNVNIRSGPGTGYGVVGSLDNEDEIEILEQFEIGDTTWGCTSKGWVCMDYVEMD